LFSCNTSEFLNAVLFGKFERVITLGISIFSMHAIIEKSERVNDQEGE